MLTQDALIGVAGAGAMGAGIAQVAAAAGHGVVVFDTDEAALARGRNAVAGGAAALVRRGALGQGGAEALVARVRWTTDLSALAGAGLVVEAIVERKEAKAALFAELEKTLAADAAIATNTSSLSVTALAGGLARPSRFIGLHFFNPAPVMKLVEVVPGAASDPGLVDAAVALMEAWGKVAVRARDVPGFIVNRVARPFYSEGWRALEEGAADAATIDFLFRDSVGFRMGPLELGDFIGHDVNYAAATSVYEAYFGRTRFAPAPAQGRLVAAGRLGRKSGAGVYDYGEGAVRPGPRLVSPADARAEFRIGAAPLIERLLSARGASFVRDAAAPAGFVEAGGALVGFADGRSAGEVAASHGTKVALLDWSRDSRSASALAFAATSHAARAAALKVAGACGMGAVEIADRPGLIVLRAMLQLANAAADAVRDRVADADAIDAAMKFGANYPIGPMAFAAEYGFANAVAALDRIADETGDPFYRAGETLRALARGGSPPLASQSN